jgi:PKD repeat protein
VFDGSGSTDPDGNLGRFTWNFGDGSALVHTPYAPHIYLNPGQYTVSLQVDDTEGLSHTRTTTAVIGVPDGIDALLHRGPERFVVSQGLLQFDNPSRLLAFAVMKILPPHSAIYSEACRIKVFDPTGHVVYVSPLSVIACGGVGSAESYTLLSSPAKGPWRVSVDYYFVKKSNPHGELFLVATDWGFTDVVDQ